MRISDEPLINQARERFALQDYYGAIHLLQEVVDSGRSFADCHHLLGLCYDAVGRRADAVKSYTTAARSTDSMLSMRGPRTAALAQEKLQTPGAPR